MRSLRGAGLRLVILGVILATLIFLGLALSRHASTPLNDAAVGMFAGVLIGLSVMSLIRMRKRSGNGRTS